MDKRSILFRGSALAMIPLVAGCGTLDGLLPRPEVRIVAFGDSTTAGPADRDYPEMLAELLSLPVSAIANEGMGGEAGGEGAQRLERLIDSGVYPNAAFLLFWEGGNDVIAFIEEEDAALLLAPDGLSTEARQRLDETLDAVQANVEQAIDAGAAAGWRPVVATYYPMLPSLDCDPFPLNILLSGQAENGNLYVDRLNETLRRAAAGRGAILVDVSAIAGELASSDANYTNCNHLSAEGNRRVAELFATVLEPLIGGTLKAFVPSSPGFPRSGYAGSEVPETNLP